MGTNEWIHSKLVMWPTANHNTTLIMPHIKAIHTGLCAHTLSANLHTHTYTHYIYMYVYLEAHQSKVLMNTQCVCSVWDRGQRTHTPHLLRLCNLTAYSLWTTRCPRLHLVYMYVLHVVRTACTCVPLLTFCVSMLGRWGNKSLN